jgi:uncharacterized membrane protein
VTYSPVLIVHIAGGLIAILAGFISLFARKGSPLHQKAGRVFAVAMLFMAAGGAYAALLKSQRLNVIAGFFTFYLVSTAWLTVLRKQAQSGRAEWILLLLGLATGVTSWTFGWQAADRGTAIGGFIFGSIAFLCVAGDARLLIRGGVSGVQRLVRHLWRMGFALFVATASFFIGTASDPVAKQFGLRARLFTKAVRETRLPLVPVLIVLIMTVYWLFRVRYARQFRKAEQ